MKIIRPIARDMRPALRAIREEVGGAAVILSSRRIAEGVEVTAAVDFDASSLQNAMNAAAESFTAAPLPPQAPAAAPAVTTTSRSMAPPRAPTLTAALQAPTVHAPAVQHPKRATPTGVAVSAAGSPATQAPHGSRFTPLANGAPAHGTPTGGTNDTQSYGAAAYGAPPAAAPTYLAEVPAYTTARPTAAAPTAAVTTAVAPPAYSHAAASHYFPAPSAEVHPFAHILGPEPAPAAVGTASGQAPTTPPSLAPSPPSHVTEATPARREPTLNIAPAQPDLAAEALAELPQSPPPATAGDNMGSELKTLRRMLETQLAQLAWNDLTRRAPVTSRFSGS